GKHSLDARPADRRASPTFGFRIPTRRKKPDNLFERSFRFCRRCGSEVYVLASDCRACGESELLTGAPAL
ncbi:MAG: hypothetical protein ACRDRL_15410, partial [Sciscionella sp.]